MRLDLGGGLVPAPGHVNIDLIKEADIVWDLNEGLPDSVMHPSPEYPEPVEGIRAMHVLEHLDEIIPLMNDCFEALQSGGKFEISTPLAGTPQYWQDPTHRRGFVPESFLYFVAGSPYEKEQKQYGITARFVIETNFVLDQWQVCVTLVKP